MFLPCISAIIGQVLVHKRSRKGERPPLKNSGVKLLLKIVSELIGYKLKYGIERKTVM
jgi:hypothetical protein